jgi:hypothetical protein
VFISLLFLIRLLSIQVFCLFRPLNPYHTSLNSLSQRVAFNMSHSLTNHLIKLYISLSFYSVYRCSADTVLYILYHTSVNSSLQTVAGIISEESKELYSHWDAYSLFSVIVSNQLFWVNVSAILKKQEFPYVVLKILHVLASYKV